MFRLAWGVLLTDLFCKPTDTHQYLHKKSCHPWHTKKVIPYGQALTFRRICSEDRQFQERVGELAGWLKDRGYEESLVNEQIDRVRRLDRTALLANAENRTNDQGRGERVPLVATYHPALNSLGKVARRLQSSRYCQKLCHVLFPPISLSIILTLISFRNPWWPSSVKCLKNSTWGTEAPN